MEQPLMLQFKSLDDLWAFRIEALIDFIEIDKSSAILTCKCSPPQIQLATNKYKAAIILPEQSVD